MAKRLGYGEGTIWQRKDGYWAAQITAGWTERGTRYRPTVVARTRAEVDRKRKAMLLEYRTRGQAALLNRRMTLKAWATRWLADHVSTLRPNVQADYRSKIQVWVIPTIGHRPVQELTPGDIRAVTQAVLAAGRSSTTAANVHRCLMTCLRDAVREGLTVPAAVLATRAPKLAISTRTSIPVDDAKKLLTAALDVPDTSRWAAALLQGMRQGECLGLTWDHVDLTAGTLTIAWQLQALPYADRATGTFVIPHGYEARHLTRAFHLVRPKTKAGERTIPLVPFLLDTLTAWRDTAPENPWELVWPRGDGEPRRPHDDRAGWVALQEAAGVTKADGTRYVLHEARHTTATLLRNAGVDPSVIVDIMGHTDAATSRGYMHSDHAARLAALDAVAARLGLRADLGKR